MNKSTFTKLFLLTTVLLGSLLFSQTTQVHAASCPLVDDDGGTAGLQVSSTQNISALASDYYDCTAQDVTVTSAGSIVLQGNTSTGDIAEIHFINLTIDSSGSISASGKGCVSSSGSSSGYGPNTSTNICSQSPGYGTPAGTDYAGGGGGYGGSGGKSSHNEAGGQTYGSSTSPTLFGTSGGYAVPGYGTPGIGGGVVRIDASGTFTNNGSVAANGTDGSRRAGAGSGGSVYITAATIAGSGDFQASGGSAGTDSWHGGGAGGGRIAITYASSSFSFDSTDFDVDGGTATASAVDGDKGTVYVKDTTNNNVNIYHGFTYDDTDYSVATWTADSSSTNQYCASGTTTPSITASGAITIGGTLNCTPATTLFDWSAGGAITLSDSASVTINGPLDFDIGSTSTWTNATVTIPSEKIFTIDNSNIGINLSGTTTVNTNVDWYILSLIIGSNASINANGKGCVHVGGGSTNGYGPNVTTNICSQSPGYGTSVGTDYGSGGGGYGGSGGQCSHNEAGGQAYGSSTDPILFGSSAGHAYPGYGNGGSGGGLVQIITVGAFSNNGSVTANGANGSRRAGGGSGGSINIDATTFTCSTGSFSASGGNGGDDQWDGGGGGGGRVAIGYVTDNSSGACTLSSLAASGVSAGGVSDGAGTSGSVGTYTYTQNIPPTPTFTEFSSTYGTDLSALSDFSDVDLTLGTQNATVHWSSNLNIEGANLDSAIQIEEGMVSIDTTTLTQLNAPATITMHISSCDNYGLWYATGTFSSFNALKADGGTLFCEAYEDPDCSESAGFPAISGLSCIGGTLTFTVPEFSTYGGGAIEEIPTEVDVASSPPAFTASPSDGGSNSATGTGDNPGYPTQTGSNVTFTATAHDINEDNYFLAVCKTDEIATGTEGTTPNPPECTGGEWEISSSIANDVQASITYTAGSGDESGCTSDESCSWFAFVCDDKADVADATQDPQCFPATGSGDQGLATGVIVFDDVPNDGSFITVDSTAYEFDDSGTPGFGVGQGCEGSAADVCVDISDSDSPNTAAIALQNADNGGGSHMVNRGENVYVYADTEGAVTIALTETTDTGDDISFEGLTGNNLTGGSDDNKSPFEVNHRPAFDTVVTDDASGSGNTIEPGDTVYVSATITDADISGTQDEVTLVACVDGDTFTPAGGCSSETLCTSTTAAPGTHECSFNANKTTVPTAHADYPFELFAYDEHDFVATDSPDHSYTVQDTDPYLGTYTTEDIILSAAQSTDTEFTVIVKDDNGDRDVTSVSGILFDKDTVTPDPDGMITADETNENFGEHIAIGDFNGNNQDDLMVTSSMYNSTPNHVYIFLDGSTPTSPSSADVIITGPNGTSEGDFGSAIIAGDFNYDTKVDLAIGHARYDGLTGRVYLFYGNGDGTFGSGSCTTGCDITDADVIITGENGSDWLGGQLHAGDMDNDGDTDLIVGSHGYGTGSGGIFIFYNDRTGTYPTVSTDADVIIKGENNGDFFGLFDFAIGDFDDNGKMDLAAGTSRYDDGGDTDAGRAYIFYNNDGIFAGDACLATPPCSATNADVIITGENNGDNFAASITGGDLDNDNDDDFAVGAWGSGGTLGRVYIFHSNGDGTFGTGSCSTGCTFADADAIITGQTNEYIGYPITIGDYNNNSKDDLVVGAQGYNSEAGALYLFYQDDTTWGTTTCTTGCSTANADHIIKGENAADWFPVTYATGDLNNDNKTDIIVSSYYGDSVGRVYAFYNDGKYPEYAGDGFCEADENDCYIDSSCTLNSGTISSDGSGKTATGSDNELTATCNFTAWFNANEANTGMDPDPTEFWEVHANPSDGMRIGDEADSENNITVNSLAALDVVQASIAYGTVEIGATSLGQETAVGNVGNQVLDILVDGTNMTDGSNTIPRAQQKYHHESGTFDWTTAGYVLIESAGVGNEVQGCLNRDIDIRDIHDATATNESVFWKLRVPGAQSAGSYAGANTFATTADDTCTGTEY